MPDNENEKDDDLLEGVYQGEIQLELQRHPVRDFKPWHKPRKHYIRIHQWCELVRELIEEADIQKGATLTYLGMPGEDFLDVRSVHGVCERAHVRLRYLGFDSTAPGDGYELNLSNHEVCSLPYVDPASLVLRDRLENLAKNQSMASFRTRRFGPFDVLNVDLCDCVGGVGKEGYFATLQRLFEMQLQARVKPWLLLIATKAERPDIDVGVKAKLLGCIRRNILDNPGFAAALEEKLALTDEGLAAEGEARIDLQHMHLVNAFVLGLGKWMLQLLMGGRPPIKVALRSGFSYRVGFEEPNMVSLAFWMQPLVQLAEDQSGIVPQTDLVPTLPTEHELAQELVEAVQRIRDVDRLLHDSPELMQRMIQKSGELLTTARYSIEDYKRWVVKNTPNIK